MTKSFKVKAVEAYTRDVGRTIARLDPKYIEELDISDGGYVEIRGTSTTAAKCLPLYPSDWDQGITRMDGLLRHNAGVSSGDLVEVSRAKVTPARRVLVTPLGEHSEVTSMFIRQWQKTDEPVESKFASEALSGTPAVDGDLVVIDYRLDKLVLLVLGKEPAAGVSVIGRETKIDLVPWLTLSA